MNSRITCLECIQPIPIGEEVRVNGLCFCKKCAKIQKPNPPPIPKPSRP